MKADGFMLRLTIALWRTDKEMIMNIGFCVLKGILEMRNKGVYESTLIKMRCYWPKGIHRDSIAY